MPITPSLRSIFRLPVQHLHLVGHEGFELVAFEDLDVVEEAEDEAGGAFQTAHVGAQDVAVGAVGGEVLVAEGVLLHQQVGGAQGESQLYGEALRAVHAEDVHVAGFVQLFVAPAVGQDLHLPDAGDLEHLHLHAFGLETPHLVEAGGDFVRLYQPVGGGVAVRRAIVVQNDLPLAADGLRELVEVAAVCGIHGYVGNELAVVQGVELLFQLLLISAVRVDGVDGGPQDVGLLFREVEQLAQLPRQLVVGLQPVDVALLAFHHEPHVQQSVLISVEGALGDVEVLAHLRPCGVFVVQQYQDELHDSRVDGCVILHS